MPSQWEWVRTQIGLSEAECEYAAWAMTPDGKLYAGAAAVSVTLDRLLGSIRFFYSLYRFPGLRHASNVVYNWISTNRAGLNRWFKATPAIKLNPPWSPDE